MVTKEMSPIFNTIPEFNTFETLLDMMIVLNRIMTKLDKIFTVQSIYGTSLFNIFELNLASNVFISTPQLLRTNVNFHRVSQPDTLFNYLILRKYFIFYLCLDSSIFVESQIRKR
jgi:hypothetical protein